MRLMRLRDRVMKRLSKRDASRHPPRDTPVTKHLRRSQAQIRGSATSIGSNSASPMHAREQTFVTLGFLRDTGLSSRLLVPAAVFLGSF
jgi:hypothetical protein